MTSAFAPAVDVVLAHEGGWSNNPADPGGATNMGITLSLFREWAGADKGADDLRKLTRADAEAIYRAEWWDRYGYGRIRDQDCATKLLDVSVNLGPGRAHRLAQKAAQQCGHPDLLADGKFGPATAAAINTSDPRAFLRAYCTEQREWYERLVVERPKMSVFLVGWLRRAAWPLSADSTP